MGTTDTLPTQSRQEPMRWRGTRRRAARLLQATRSWPIYVLSLVVMLGAWYMAAKLFGIEPLFPTPATALRRLWQLTLDGTVFTDTGVSLARILVGFIIGSLVGTVLGLLMGMFAPVRAIAEPFVHFFRFIPPLAWFAPVLLLFGTGEDSRMGLIAYTTIFVVAINTMDGAMAVPANKLHMAASLGATRSQLFRLVTLPASVPYVLVGMRMAMGNAFMTVVAAEMLAASNGLGYLLISSQSFFDVPAIFAVILVLGIIGFLTDKLFEKGIDRFGGRYFAHRQMGRPS